MLFRSKDRQADTEKHLSRSRKHQAKLKKGNPKKYTASQQRGSAKKRADAYGLDYNLTTEYIMSISPDVCPVLGIELKYGGGEKTNNSASLDRIDPAQGYVEGNVQVISNLANLMKSNASEEHLRAFAEWVLRTYEKSKGVAR